MSFVRPDATDLEAADELELALYLTRAALEVHRFVERYVCEQKCNALGLDEEKDKEKLEPLDYAPVFIGMEQPSDNLQARASGVLLAVGDNRLVFSAEDILNDDAEHQSETGASRQFDFAEIAERVALEPTAATACNWMNLENDQFRNELYNLLQAALNACCSREARYAPSVDSCCPGTVLFLRRLVLGCAESARANLVNDKMHEAHLDCMAEQERTRRYCAAPDQSEFEARYTMELTTAVAERVGKAIETKIIAMIDERTELGQFPLHEKEHCETCAKNSRDMKSGRRNLRWSLIRGYSERVDLDLHKRLPVLHLCDFVVYPKETAVPESRSDARGLREPLKLQRAGTKKNKAARLSPSACAELSKCNLAE